jgi:hypothetical protein
MSDTPPPAGPSRNPDFGGWAPPPAPGSQPAATQYPPQPTAPQFPQQSAPQYPPQFQPQQPSGPWQPGLAQQGPAQQPPYPPSGAPFAPQPASAPKKGRGKLIGSIAAVVVLAGGGIGTYVAMSDSGQHGAATPDAAVQTVFDDLQKSDLLGVLDDLVPAERDALASPLNDQINELKRLHVFDSGADLHHVPGFTFSAGDLKFGAVKKITDKVSVVALTGGTIDVSYNASKLPISHDFLSAVGGSVPQGASSSQHVNVADAPTPPQLAAQQVGGRWYPSLFYTVGYNALGQRAPRAGDYIPASGADSAGAAAQDMVRALLQGDYRSAIQLLSPEEMAVVHDYGGSVTNSATGDTGVTISKLETTTTSLSGGAERVSLKSLVMTTKDGQTLSVSIDGDCVSTSGAGQSQKFCANDVAKVLATFAGDRAAKMTAAQQQAFENLFRGLLKVGIVTSQTDGKWYVNPVRSYGDVGNTITSQLQDDDLLRIIGFFKQLGR